MPKLKQYDTPADIEDIQNDPSMAAKFRAVWSQSLDRMTRQTIQNLPWAFTNQGHLGEYYDPLVTDIPDDAKVAPIKWIAFPNRILKLFPNASQREQWKYADDGPPDIDGHPYTPQGPRGFQDEYCEWSVTRNSDGKITKVMYTCENREYWFSLWRTDPQIVVDLYRKLISEEVQESDLYLMNSSTGEPVIDRETGKPVYNDLNKWNSTTTNGAVHLVSNPNALSAEILIAGQATIPRDKNGQPVVDGNPLLECGPLGQPNRNSDPHISESVNELVREPNNLQVSLKNPVGLYIQEPDFSTYSLPLGATGDPADFWTIVRGKRRDTPDGIDEILHAVYEVPADKGFVVGDIQIAGFNIEYGSQLTKTFQIALAGLGFPISGDKPTPQPCRSDKSPTDPWVQQLIDSNLAANGSRDPLPPRIEQGTSVSNLVMFTSGVESNATITIDDGVTVQIDDVGTQGLFHVTVIVAEDAPPGDRAIKATNTNGATGPAAVGLLEIVHAGTLAQTDLAMADYQPEQHNVEGFVLHTKVRS